MNKSFQQFILISFGIHVALVGMLVYWPSLFPHRSDDLKNTKVRWVKLSYGQGGTNTKSNPKNLKQMPKATLAEQKKALKHQKTSGKDAKYSAGNAKKNKKSKVKKVVRKKTTKKGGINIKKKSEDDKLNKTMEDALARVSAQKKKQQAQIGAAQASKGETGQSLQGSGQGSELGAELLSYYRKVQRKVRQEWIVVKSQTSQNLISRIVVRIDRNGNIIRAYVKRSSGDNSFDQSAMRAINRAKPFPIPPSLISPELARDGFEFVFNPKNVSGRIL